MRPSERTDVHKKNRRTDGRTSVQTDERTNKRTNERTHVVYRCTLLAVRLCHPIRTQSFHSFHSAISFLPIAFLQKKEVKSSQFKSSPIKRYGAASVIGICCHRLRTYEAYEGSRMTVVHDSRTILFLNGGQDQYLKC